MSKNWKIALTGAAAIAALSAGTALYAQADKPASGQRSMMHSGTMMGGSGDMKNMMEMMGQMNQMMEGCNKMMQDISSSKGKDQSAPKASSQQ